MNHWTGKRGCGLYGYHHEYRTERGRRRMDAMVSREWYGWAVVLLVNPETGSRRTPSPSPAAFLLHGAAPMRWKRGHGAG